MSLINQMLRDLETRRAGSSEKQSLPNEVRPLPAAGAAERGLTPLLLVAAAIAASVAIGWGFVELTTQPPPSVTASVPAAPPPIHHESALKLDPDLTAARIPPVLMPPPRQAKVAAPAEMPPPPKVSAPAATNEIVAMPIEKRAPTTDNNGSPTQRAREQLNAGQREAAETTLKQAVQATPGHVAARQMLFGLMLEQRRNDEALALLKEGLALLPEQTQWASNAARLQVDRDDVPGAWETLQHSLPAAATQGEYRAFCGTVLSRLKRYGEAVGHYQAALRTNPTEGRWWVGMALAFDADGKPAESREAFSRALATGKLPPELAAFVESKLKQ